MNVDRITHWLSQLVQIPSVCPAHAGPRAGKTGEAQIVAALADWFAAFGADQIITEEVHPGRPNLYAIWHGHSDEWVAIDTHTDTVGVEQMTDDPFDGRVENGRVWGRGAVDTKATLGILLALLEAMQRQGIRPKDNLIIVATANEESGLGGAKVFANWARQQSLQLSKLVVAEPTMCAPVHGHKGGMGLEISVRGLSAHTSTPHRGKNAIMAAAPLIVAMEQEHARLQTLTPTSELGNGTLTVSEISGGIGRNIVPDVCKLYVGRRLVPDEDPQEIANGLVDLARRSCPLPIEVEHRLGVRAFYQSPDTPWLRELSDWTGAAPLVVPYGTNALMYDNLSKEMVVFGPGSIDQAHGEVEWVEISQLEKAAVVYQRWLQP